MNATTRCEDLMSISEGCDVSTKEFQDLESDCGTTNAEQCLCGETKTNSHQKLTDVLVPGCP